MSLVLGLTGQRKAGKSTVSQIIAQMHGAKNTNVLIICTDDDSPYKRFNYLQDKSSLDASPIVFQSVLASANLQDNTELLDYGYQIAPNVTMFNIKSSLLSNDELKATYSQLIKALNFPLVIIDIFRYNMSEEVLKFLDAEVIDAYIDVIDYDKSSVARTKIDPKERTLYLWNRVSPKTSASLLASMLKVPKAWTWVFPIDTSLKEAAFKGNLSNYIATRNAKDGFGSLEQLIKFLWKV